MRIILVAAAAALLLAACTTPPPTQQIDANGEEGFKLSEQSTVPCTAWEPDAFNGKTCAVIQFNDQGGINGAQIISGREGAGTEIVKTIFTEDGEPVAEWRYKQDETRAFEGQKFVQDFRATFVKENAELIEELGKAGLDKMMEAVCIAATGGACAAVGLLP